MSFYHEKVISYRCAKDFGTTLIFDDGKRLVFWVGLDFPDHEKVDVHGPLRRAREEIPQAGRAIRGQFCSQQIKLSGQIS